MDMNEKIMIEVHMNPSETLHLSERIDDWIWGTKSTPDCIWNVVAKHVAQELGIDKIPTNENDPGYHLHYQHTRRLIASVINELQKKWIL